MLLKKDRTDLAFQLYQLQSSLFRGRLDIESPDGTRWSLYFYLGRLVWQAGGVNPSERWHRLLTQQCPETKGLGNIQFQDSEFNGYNILSELLNQGKSKRSQMVILVKDALVEVLFDILQYEYLLQSKQPDCQLSFTSNARDYLPNVFTLVRIDQTLTEATKQWELWQKMKLTSYSPNLAPIIQQPERLRQNLVNSIDKYWALTKLLNGKRTLRSLALELKQPLPKLTLFLLQFVNVGIINLVEVEQGKKNTSLLNRRTSPKLTKTLGLSVNEILPDAQSTDEPIPLVICIDDSPTVCTHLEKIVTGAGCRFVAIQDPVKAIPSLLRIKPDLIFLDLVMPIVNGYELCAQIRRISMIKNIPIVILTGKDGLVDRVRTKIVGANEFLAKPVNQERVSSILYKFALAKPPSS